MIVIALGLFAVLAFLGLRDTKLAAAAYIWQALFRPHEFPLGWRDGPLQGPPWNMGMLGMLIISWLLRAKEYRPRLGRLGLLVTADVAILVWAALQGQNQVANMIAMQAILQKWGTYWIFTFIAAHPDRYTHFARTFGVILGLTGLVGFVNQFGLDAYARFDQHEIVGPGGDISDRNDFAMNLALGVGLLVPIALNESTWRWRLFYLGLAGTSSMVCVVSGSRGGFLGLGLAMSYALARLHHKRWFVLMAVIAGVGVLMHLPPEFYERILGVQTAATQDESAMKRICAWRAAGNMARQHTFGIGPGAWSSRIRRYEVETFQNGQLQRCESATAPHSHVYGMLGEAGWPGAIVWVLTMIAAYFFLWRAELRLNKGGLRRSPLWYTIIGVRCAYLPYAVSGAFLSCQYHETFFLLMVCCSCADLAADMAVRRHWAQQQAKEAENNGAADGSSPGASLEQRPA